MFSADDSHALITTIDGDVTTGSITRVAVIDTSTGAQSGTTLTLTGSALGYPALFNADGTRALITTDDGRVAVIDTITGAQIGTTLTLPGSTFSALKTADAGRALITTGVAAAGSGAGSTLATLIDTTTGKQIGTTVALAGTPYQPVMTVGANRAVITTYVADSTGYNILDTQVTMINTATGAQIGAALTLPGPANAPLLSADGSRALIANAAGVAVIIDTTTDSQTGSTFTVTGAPQAFDLANADGTRALITTRVSNSANLIEDTTLAAVIDIPTGTQIGTTLTVSGGGTPLLTADGTRALIATQVYDYGARLTDPHSTRVAVIDTTTGRQIGTTLTLPGKLYGAQRLSADGTHILITTSPWNTFTNTGSTKMAVIDTTTGAPAGSTLTIKGETAVEPLFSADGTRALIATTVFSRTAVATRVGVLRITSRVFVTSGTVRDHRLAAGTVPAALEELVTVT